MPGGRTTVSAAQSKTLKSAGTAARPPFGVSPALPVELELHLAADDLEFGVEGLSRL